MFTIEGASSAEVAIAALSLDTLHYEIVLQGEWRPRYVPTGHLVYSVGTTLRAVRFDPETLATTGAPLPVLEGVLEHSTGANEFSVAGNGTLLYLPADSALRTQIGWVDREGRPLEPVADDVVGRPTLSPDGRLIAFGRVVTGSTDLWVHDVESGREVKVAEGDLNLYPVWTPDSESVTFSSTGAGALNLYSRRVDLSSEAEALLVGPTDDVPGSWTPDGRALVYYEVKDGVRNIRLLSPGSEPESFLEGEHDEFSPRLSPSGDWLAYLSDRDGEVRLYVQRFPEGGRVIPVSVGRATEPLWSRDGQELFYRDGNQLWVVDVETEPDFRPGAPRLLFEAPYQTDLDGLGNTNYDISLDGERFLMVSSASGSARLVVVLNWFEELKRLVPIDWCLFSPAPPSTPTPSPPSDGRPDGQTARAAPRLGCRWLLVAAALARPQIVLILTTVRRRLISKKELQ